MSLSKGGVKDEDTLLDSDEVIDVVVVLVADGEMLIEDEEE